MNQKQLNVEKIKTQQILNLVTKQRFFAQTRYYLVFRFKQHRM